MFSSSNSGLKWSAHSILILDEFKYRTVLTDISLDAVIHHNWQLFPIFLPVRESLYSGRSMDPYIFGRSVDPYIFVGSWIPFFRSVHRSLYLDRSVDFFILECPWIPLFIAVRGPLYSSRSMDLYIQSGPWIPIFWPVHGSL